MRGGFFPIHLAVLLNGDAFPDLSAAALGAWVRLRALGEFTGEPVSPKAAARLGITSEMIDELRTAGLLDGELVAIGMPGIPRKPSDEPEATRARKAAEREREKQREKPSESNPIQSSVTPSRVTERDGVEKDADDEAYEVWLSQVRVNRTRDRYEAMKARATDAPMPSVKEVLEDMSIP